MGQRYTACMAIRFSRRAGERFGLRPVQEGERGGLAVRNARRRGRLDRGATHVLRLADGLYGAAQAYESADGDEASFYVPLFGGAAQDAQAYHDVYSEAEVEAFTRATAGLRAAGGYFWTQTVPRA